MSTADIIAVMKHPDQHYLDVRELPDGSIAGLQDLIYTRSIVLGCDMYGWTTRFCFKDRALATRRFAELVSDEDVPEGFIDRRPEVGP